MGNIMTPTHNMKEGDAHIHNSVKHMDGINPA